MVILIQEEEEDAQQRLQMEHIRLRFQELRLSAEGTIAQLRATSATRAVSSPVSSPRYSPRSPAVSSSIRVPLRGAVRQASDGSALSVDITDEAAAAAAAGVSPRLLSGELMVAALLSPIELSSQVCA